MKQIREEFEKFKGQQDLNGIKFLLRDGHTQLKMLEDQLGLSAVNKRQAS